MRNGFTAQRHFTKIILLGLAASLITGCASSVSPSIETILISADEYGNAFQTAVNTLRTRQFQIDRQDYRFGRITTKPRASSSSFEFWKGENITFNDSAASTLNDQQRIVAVLLEPAGEAYNMRVEVTVERVQQPGRILTGSTDGHAIASTLHEVPIEERRAGVTSKHWRKVGRDGHMERALLQAIQDQLGSMASATP